VSKARRVMKARFIKDEGWEMKGKKRIRTEEASK
jgi:hypothetical protein